MNEIQQEQALFEVLYILRAAGPLFWCVSAELTACKYTLCYVL